MDNNNQPIETKNYRKAKMSEKKKNGMLIAASAVALCLCAVAFWFWHPHVYSVKEIIKAPTCIEAGEGVGKCFCGKTEIRAIEMVEHDLKVIGTKAPTCTETGEERLKCSCGETAIRTLEMIEHTDVIDKGYEATKTESGLTDGRHCGVCGEILEEQKTIYAFGSLGLAHTLTSDTTCEITGIGTCKDVNIIIPEYIDGYEVTSIGDESFFDCSSLTSITIPDSVTSIGDEAFYHCRNLTNIIIPDSVTSIGECAFSWCNSLTSITVSENNQYYKSIDGVLFTYNGKSLICYPLGEKEETYIIPNGVTSIVDKAFFECRGLTSITIPDSVTSIGNSAFSWCNSLTSITIPNSVTNIDKCAFSWCSNLTSVTIPEGVTSIEDWTFSYCSSLTYITIPESVASIAERAFLYCNLTSINYNGTVAQWQEISKGMSWEYDIVSCADGTITKDGTVAYN